MKTKMLHLALMTVAMVMAMAIPNTLWAQEVAAEDGELKKIGGVKSLEQRIQELEEAVERKVEGDKWYDRIQISGLVEVNAWYQSIDFDDPAEEDEKTSDVDLATVELVVDAKIAAHVDGHVLFKYEEDDVFVDEGFITLVGTEAFPAYLIAGRQYLPFGVYDSFFVTDPNTLVLGETNDGAIVAGYRFGEGMIDLSLGAYNGDVDEAGEDNQIDSFVARVYAQPVSFLTVSASYTSNLASSNGLSEFVADPVQDMVGGWSAEVTFEWSIARVIGEYVGALDEFEVGEVYESDTQARKPSAWNVEAGVAPMDGLELAIRYGGADDGGAEFLPETQYGVVVNWGIFEKTNLAVEYMHDEFEDDFQEVEMVTAQLAVEF